MDLKKIISALNSSSKYLPEIQKHAVNYFLKNPSIENFKKIPTISKKEIFKCNIEIEKIVSVAKLEKRHLILSAGSSNDAISFRLSNSENEVDSNFINLINKINVIWNLSLNDTLILNCYPLGTTFPKAVNVIEVGPRIDLIPTIINSVGKYFKNYIFIGYPSAAIWCVNNNLLPRETFFLLGGEKVPSYFIRLMSLKLNLPESSISERIVTLYGLAEVGLGLAINTEKIRNNLGNDDFNIFAIDQTNYLGECIENELILSNVSQQNISLFRYKSGDLISTFNEINFNLTSFKYICRKEQSEVCKIILDLENLIYNNLITISDTIIGYQINKLNEVSVIFNAKASAQIGILKKLFDQDKYAIKLINNIDTSRKAYANIY